MYVNWNVKYIKLRTSIINTYYRCQLNLSLGKWSNRLLINGMACNSPLPPSPFNLFYLIICILYDWRKVEKCLVNSLIHTFTYNMCDDDGRSSFAQHANCGCSITRIVVPHTHTHTHALEREGCMCRCAGHPISKMRPAGSDKTLAHKHTHSLIYNHSHLA